MRPAQARQPSHTRRVLLLTPGMLEDVDKEMKGLELIRRTYTWFPVGLSSTQVRRRRPVHVQ